MSQHVQELIDKIKSEGIQTAKQEAGEIAKQAQDQANKINEEAIAVSDQLLQNSNDDIKKMHESTHMALKQASRDMLLALRGEIENMLKKIISSQVKDSLSSAQLANIIAEVIKGSSQAGQSTSDIRVTLNANDLKELNESFVAKLKAKVKGTIKLEASEDIDKGFTISYDAGKSNFDFTDESLAQFLSQYLNSQVSDLLKESV